MKKGLLLFGIVSLLAVLVTLNIKAATFTWFTNLEVPLYQIDKGVVLNKYDNNSQVVKNQNAPFSRGFEAKATANGSDGNSCTTLYKTLTRNTSVYFGNGSDLYCSYYHNSNNNAMLSIRTTSSHNDSSYFNGWWTTTTSNCGDLGC